MQIWWALGIIAAQVTMDFPSPLFLFLFTPVFFFAYFVARERSRLVVILAASALFYAWGNLAYLPLMAGIILVNYLLGLGLDRWRGEKRALALLWAGILANIAVLVVFKLLTSIPYPLGLSYISFQAVAYLVELHKRPGQGETDLLKFASYILLFPKIMVGPITRYGALKFQLDDPQVSLPALADGIRRFIRGLAKKVLIADTLARIVIPVFKLETASIEPWLAWLVLIAYSLQLFFDFSGYTDMALGLGQMMGLKFMENFNFPYVSKNIGEFWRRWHISLSNWFRDFVFYPLERRRLPLLGQQINILVVFLLTGLWHGFSRTFIIWGLLHGLALVFEATPPGRKLRTVWTPIQHVYALAVILGGWVFFRSPSLGFALEFFSRLFGNTANLTVVPFSEFSPLPIIEPSVMLALAVGLIFSLPVASTIGNWLKPRLDGHFALSVLAQSLYDLSLLFLLVVSIAAIASGNFAPNIYGNF